MKRYRKSIKPLIPILLIELLLSWFLIGLPFLVLTLWRYFGKELVLGETGVVIRSGVIIVQETEVKYSKVNSISITRGMIPNVGTIILLTGNDVVGVSFGPVDNPEILKQEIDARIGKA